MSVALALLLIHCGGRSETASALLLAGSHHGRRDHRLPIIINRPNPDARRSSSRRPLTTSSPLFYATSEDPSSSSISDAASRTAQIREMALKLMEENAMPPPSSALLDDDVVRDSKDGENDDHHHPPDRHHPGHHYDDDRGSPVGSEFASLTSSFLSYTERDIRSLTSTSNLYFRYHRRRDDGDDSSESSRSSSTMRPKPRQRSREDGIRYRTLYSGVKSASSDPEITRAFAILFEDYLPIRIAGRRIYGHLTTVMEEVREERDGEIARAGELCPDWDDRGMISGEGETSLMECARDVWDTLVDEVLLVDDSLESAVGVIPLSQLIRLGIDRLLMEEGMVNGAAELEGIVRATVLQEERDIEERYHTTKKHAADLHEDAMDLKMTFATFMKVMYCTALSKESEDGNRDVIRRVLQRMERRALDHRIIGDSIANDKDISTLLAARAVHAGSTSRCEKRAKWSDRFDEYVSTFQLWERKFLLGNNNGNNDLDDVGRQQQKSSTRRFEILRGCFVGARNERNVAALKIVYMDYAALRIGGDLIFQLMSKIANRIIK